MKSSTRRSPACPAHPYLQTTQRCRLGRAGSSAARGEPLRHHLRAPRWARDCIGSTIWLRSRRPPMRPRIWRSSGAMSCRRKFSRSCAKLRRGKNGEIQFTDALRQLVQHTPMFAHEIQGQRHDAGDKLGFLIATVELALKNPSLDLRSPSFCNSDSDRPPPTRVVAATDVPARSERAAS